MDKIITRSLLRSYHNGIKSFLKTAEDSEIAAIVDGIDFVDVPVVTEKRYPILYTYRSDHHWLWQCQADTDEFNRFANSTDATFKLYTNDGTFVVSGSPYTYVLNDYAALTEYSGVSFYNSSSGADSLSNALIVDGKILFQLDLNNGFYGNLNKNDDVWPGGTSEGDYRPFEIEFFNKCNGGYVTFE